MSSLTGNEQHSVHDVQVDPDEPGATTVLTLGTELWAPSGRRWIVRAFHPGHRIELVADGPTGPIGMIVDDVAAARMVPINQRLTPTGDPTSRGVPRHERES